MGGGDKEGVWNDAYEQELMLEKEADGLSKDLLFRRDGCLKRLLAKPFADIDPRRIVSIIVS